MSWTPGTPWRPTDYALNDFLRNEADPETIAARLACDKLDAKAEAHGVACPVCAAPRGQPCFGPETRSNHPQRASAHWDAQIRARAA